MTSRQAGRRVAFVRRRKKNGKRTVGRTTQTRSSGGQRQLIQLVICSMIFVLLVAAKLLLPQKMEGLNSRLENALEKNMDVQTVFSAIGKAVAGEEDMSRTADEVYQAVFQPEEDAVEAAALISGEQAGMGLDALRQYRQAEAEPAERAEETPDSAEALSMAYVLYSSQNLPENVSLEQAILNFDYCTPVSGVLSSGFGYREHPLEGEDRFHYGVDLAADNGAEILCFADGIVTAVGESSSYGKYCMVAHEGGYTTLYAHCSRITVSSGAQVRLGEKLAEVGQTGMATGPHLHFELCRDGAYLNPIYYVSCL